jgi:hypothetical protein
MGIPAAPSRSGLTEGGEQTHVQAATAEIFPDPAVARFPHHWPLPLPSRTAVSSRRLHISPAGYRQEEEAPESPLGRSMTLIVS